MLIREVILEDFMSYEYARVPFKPGVNIICGPNGSGKSSMLLAISVALGQSYTERSKKLSDLIRWGKEQARVTLVLDNSRKGNRRPVPKIKKDSIFLTRVLRRDGEYWFELDNRAATKSEVTRLLSKFGVDPDNMLIIMHQNMVEQFTVLPPQEKLRMVEAAVGFESYRKNVLNAKRKLSRALSQEESVGKLLESAQQTLSYWREQYERYQKKKQLRMKRRFLERELAWAEVAKRKRIVSELKKQIQKEQDEVFRLKDEAKTVGSQLDELQERLEQLKAECMKLFEDRVALEREKAMSEVNVSLSHQTLSEARSWTSAHQEQMKKCLSEIELLERTLSEIRNPANFKAQLNEVRTAYENLENTWIQQFDKKCEYLKGSIENTDKELGNLNVQIADVQTKTSHLNLEMESRGDDLVNHKINLALLEFREDAMKRELEKLDKELQTSLEDLSETVKQAETVGPQILPVKGIIEILDEIRVTDGHLAALVDVSENIERMYESYSKLYLELSEKAQLVAENREKALEEVSARMETWKTVLQDLLDSVNLQYQKTLSQVQALGEIRLVDKHDIEAAGLDVLVGFKGVKPVSLNAYTQSGGERTTATMAFLLALQQHVRSPLRAVDEYDVHMDPRNREAIADLFVSSVGGLDSQYLAITPSQLTFEKKDVHIITVQNVEGTTLIKEFV